MKTRTLGPFTVSAIGLGAMPLSMVRDGQQGWDHANETVHAALDAGVTYCGDTSGVVGISNANVEENEVAIEVLGEDGLASVQNEFSPRFRCSRDELEQGGRAGLPGVRRDRHRARGQPAAGGAPLLS